MTNYTKINLGEIKNAAAEFGYTDNEARFAKKDLELEQSGLSHHKLKPNKHSPFGHRHEKVEEVYIVLSGSGQIKLDDDIVDIKPLDAIRVPASIARAFAAGSDGLEWLVYSPRADADRGEMLTNWWTD